MATRYWVGGNGGWNNVNTAYWATTSGGAGGASIPTTSDDVIFDANSGGGTCTLSGPISCRNLTCTGYTGTFLLSGGNGLTLGGSLTLANTMTVTLPSGQFIFYFRPNATGQSITCAGRLAGLNVGFDIYSASGYSVFLADACSIATLSVAAGTFQTTSQALTCTGGITAPGTGTKTLTLGTSTITIGGSGFIVDYTNTGVTLGLATLIFTGNSPTLSMGPGMAFGTVKFVPASSSGADITLTGSTSNTFGTLWFDYSAVTLDTSIRRATLPVGVSIGVSTSFAVIPPAAGKSSLLRSSAEGTQVLLNAGSTTSVTDCNFLDIGVTGTTLTGTRLGNIAGNSNISFPTGVTRYWVGGAGAFSDTTHWSTTSGGAGGASVPLPQDDVVFDASSGSGTVTFGYGVVVNNFTATASTPSYLDISYGFGVCGDYNDARSSGTQTTVMLRGRTNTKTLSNTGVNVQSLYVLRGGYVLSANLWANGTISVQGSGILDGNNFNVTSAALLAQGSTSNLKMKAGTWTLTGVGTVFSYSGGGTLSADLATIVLSDTSTSSRLFTGGGGTFGKLVIGGSTGTSITTIAGSNTFGELASTKTVAHTVKFNYGSTTTIGKWSISGSAGNLVTIASDSLFTYNLASSSGIQSADYLSISYAVGTTANTWYVGANSTNGGNNSNILFQAAPPQAKGLFFGSNF